MHLYQKIIITRVGGVVCRLFLLALVIGIPLFSSATEPFKIWSEKIPGGYRFFVRSPDAFPRSFQVSFSKLENLSATIPLPLKTSLSSKVDSLPLFDLKAINPRKRFEFDFDYSCLIGDFKTARHDETVVYWLPFQNGTKHYIHQGYRGDFSHFEKGKEFALDFNMPIGTPIMAARAGIVAEKKEDSDQGGANKSFKKHGNYVFILHADGSIAQYVHLKKNGATVKVGDSVKAGEQIGLSGETGHATGPHLHFQVGLTTSEGKVKTVPTRFYNLTAKPVLLVAGQYGYAFHPKKQQFKTDLGRSIASPNYDNYRKSIARGDKIATRSKFINGTTVLFIRNEFPEAKDITITFPKLENIVISKDLPVVVSVAPLTEKFVLFMKLKETGKPFSYRVKLKYRNSKK